MACTPPVFDKETLPDLPVGSLSTATVTEGCVDGAGIYDVFMRAHTSAIQQEYSKQRLKGTDYSKVYLGGMQAAMQQAVVFALGQGKAAAETELARYAMLKAQSDIALVQAQICLTEAQIEKMLTDAKLTEIQCWTEFAKINDDPSIVATADVYLLRENVPNTLEDNSIFGAQILKSVEDKHLVIQKTTSELGQTKDNFTPRSILGRQSDMHKAQANGFNRNAEVSLAKLYVDGRSVAMTALDGVEQGNELTGQLDTILKIARGNIDNTPDLTD